MMEPNKIHPFWNGKSTLIPPAWLGLSRVFLGLGWNPGGFFSWPKTMLKTKAGGFQPGGSGVPGVSPADKNTTSSGTHGPNQFVRFPAARRRSESMEVAEKTFKMGGCWKGGIGTQERKIWYTLENQHVTVTNMGVVLGRWLCFI